MLKKEPQTPLSAVGSRDDALLANIALLYYNEGLTQSEIAKRAGVSRATIVNYLREGRARGIVDIRVKGEALAVSRQSRDLCAAFGLEDAYVASVMTGDDARAALRQTARIAAVALHEILAPGDKLGVAWGETIKLMSSEIPRQEVPGITVFQLIGSMRSTRLPAAETCAIQIANRLGATCFTLHAPAVLSSEALADEIRAEPAIQEQLRQLRGFDAVLYSVGDISDTTHLVDAGIVSLDDLHIAAKAGAAGVLSGRFINAAGEHLVVPIEKRMIAVELEEMRLATKRILVASGKNKLDAVRAAIAGGFVTHAILDSDLASDLLK